MASENDLAVLFSETRENGIGKTVARVRVRCALSLLATLHPFGPWLGCFDWNLELQLFL